MYPFTFSRKGLPKPPTPEKLTAKHVKEGVTYADLLFPFLVSHGLSWGFAYHGEHGAEAPEASLRAFIEETLYARCGAHIHDAYDEQGANAAMYATPAQAARQVLKATASCMSQRDSAGFRAAASAGGRAKRRTALTYEAIRHLDHLSHAEVAAIVGKGRDRVRAVRRGERQRLAEKAKEQARFDYLLSGEAFPAGSAWTTGGGAWTTGPQGGARTTPEGGAWSNPSPRKDWAQPQSSQGSEPSHELSHSTENYVLTSDEVEVYSTSDHVLTADEIDAFLATDPKREAPDENDLGWADLRSDLLGILEAHHAASEPQPFDSSDALLEIARRSAAGIL